MVEFLHPACLALLLALPVVYFLSRTSLAHLPPFRARLAWMLRMAVLVALTLALAGPRGLRNERDPRVLFLVDHSPSLAEAAPDRAAEFLAAAEKARPVGREFAEARFADSFQLTRDFAGHSRSVEPDAKAATRLHHALELAAATLPSGPGRIVVLSDGRSTDGYPTALRPGLEVDTVVLPADSRPDAWVERIQAPVEVHSEEAFNVTVAVGSNASGPATVELFQDGFSLGRQPVTLTGQPQSVSFANLQPKSSSVQLEAVVDWAGDSQPANNRLKLQLAARGKPRLLLVDAEPDRLSALAQKLRTAGMEVEVRPPEALPSEIPEWSAFDLTLLSNVPIERLSGDALAGLRTWVEDFGGGLIVTGGPDSFGAGGYFRSPLEEMLPVWSEHPDKLEMPVSALEVILDRSGSMTAMVGGQTKMELANLGAIGALGTLQNRDYFGIMAVDVRPQVVLPLAPIGDRLLAQRAIRGIHSAGGGIYVYSALQEAYRQLRPVPAKIKHAILFADASDAEEKNGPNGQTSADLAAVALGSKVTTSVVALGNETDKDTVFLRSVAMAGGGRFYLTNDATVLPQLFARETLRATQSSLMEEAFIPEAGNSAALAGIDWTTVPPLLGYNSVRPKPGVEIGMRATAGDPLLVRWPLGLGNVAVFTSDATSRWAAEWLDWPGFGVFWTQLARSLMRERSLEDFELQLEEAGEKLRVRIRSEHPAAAFTVQAAAADGARLSPATRPIAPGEWLAEFPRGNAEDWSIAVSENQGSRPMRTGYWNRRYPDEFAPPRENGPALLPALAASTGGKFNPAPAEVWRPVAVPAQRPVDLAPLFLALAIGLFLADVANRRWLRVSPNAENPLAAS